MTRLDDLRKLLDRCERAEGGERELDAEIDALLRIGTPKMEPWAWANFPVWRPARNGSVEVVHSDGSGGLNWQSQEFTTSIDAAVALVDRVLPRWGRSIYWNNCQGSLARVEDIANEQSSGTDYEARGANDALAVCAAMLRALMAVEEKAKG